MRWVGRLLRAGPAAGLLSSSSSSRRRIGGRREEDGAETQRAPLQAAGLLEQQLAGEVELGGCLRAPHQARRSSSSPITLLLHQASQVL